MELIRELLFDYTLRTVALGSALLGVVSGVLGSFAVLRRQSLMGDAISHAALPGIAVAFLLTGSRAQPLLLLGAATAGWLGMTLLLAIVRRTRIKQDTALGLILSVFFGFGLVLLTFIQRSDAGNQAGLDSYLFGQAAALLEEDLLLMSVIGGVALAAVAAFWKELKLISFDAGFAASLGMPLRALELALTWLIVLAIVIGLQTVGVVLMSAMLIAPAAAARQWTQRLSRMVMLAALFGAVAGVTGAILSSRVPGLPTGPTTVFCITLIAMASLLVGPARGLLWRGWRRHRLQSRVDTAALLARLHALALEHDDPRHPHPEAVLNVLAPPLVDVSRTLAVLADRGWIESRDSGEWALTERGLARAQEVSTGEEDA